MNMTTRGLLVAAGLALSAGPAAATQTIVNSSAPYWKVGEADSALSQACATGRFGMVEPRAYVARFTGQVGPGVLGIAKGSGLNLYDPDHLSKPNEDYFFYAGGTSSCAVFVGGRQGGGATPPAP
jgi:hypothetical protein